MKEQNLILGLFLVCAVVISAIFILIYKSSKKADEEEDGVKNPLKKRMILLIVWSGILVVAFSVTLPKSPYYLFAKETPGKVVYVAAMQYFFMMSYDAIDPKSPKNEPNIEVPSNEVVEFRVTSLDVNHGFAIYNEDYELITQTQAMPGYVNKLRWKFEKPGTYHILCLEFCGAGHQIMKSSFTVL